MIEACKNCGSNFEITDADQAFYTKIQIPKPTFCPECRSQRRLAFRNERALYRRDCDLCNKSMFSIFAKDAPFPVYCMDCWWGDNWDPLKYGQSYDFDRPFFDQYADLMKKVPKMGILTYKCENCEYNSLIALSRNCYMSPGTYGSEDSYYLRKSQYCKDCLDSEVLDRCELVYQSVNSGKCYDCSYILNCENCTSCHFMADSLSCEDCFMCSGIARKKHCVMNQQFDEEGYKAKVAELRAYPHERILKEFLKFNATIPKKYQQQINCENSFGDYIQNCKNAQFCFDGYDLEDCKYLTDSSDNCKDMMDCSCFDKDNEVCYEMCSGGDRCIDTQFCYCAVNTYNCQYLMSCIFLKNCFGCDSVPRKVEYCILNRQYSKEEYEQLLPRIIEHMKSTGEYGEFFPIPLSPFAYNESTAQLIYPMKKEEAVAKGYRWRDSDPKEYQKQSYVVPAEIKDVDEGILNEVLACSDCGKNYKIIQQELKFYKRGGFSIPQKCPDCRHKERLKIKNPRVLVDRECDKCGDGIKSTYGSGRPEKVYCEKCYLEERS